MRGPPEAAAFGVDVGGTKILAVALGAGQEVLGDARAPTPQAALTGPSGAVAGAAVADQVVAVLGRLADRFGQPEAVGLGLAGMLDTQGVLVFAPHLPGVAGTDLGSLVGERLGGAVVAENDANTAALAEHALGAAFGTPDFLMVTLGTGIGGALVAGGRLQRGAFGFAGEVGHMVVDPSGPPCPCGGRGCWERFASGAGLARLAQERASDGRLATAVAASGGQAHLVRGEQVTAAALAGDQDARAVFAELGWWTALGLANLTAVLDPGRIVVGGGLAEAGEVLLGPVRDAYEVLLEGARARPPVSIVGASFGERAGAVGAALMAARGGAR